MADISELLDAARRGDRAAFNALVRAQGNRLYGIALRITGDGARAEDVVQETFLRLLEGRAARIEPGAGAAWLAKVAANLALEALRRGKSRQRREERYAMTHEERQESPERAFLSGEDAERVTAALNGLPPETRAAIWLHAVEGVTLRETAEALGARRSTLARRVSIGLESLRRQLVRSGFQLQVALPVPALLRSLPEPQAPAALLARLEALGAAAGVGAGAGAVAGAGAGIEAARQVATVGIRLGGIMSGKKIAVSLGLAAAILGGAVLVTRPWGARESRNGREVAVVPAPGKSGPEDPGTRRTPSGGLATGGGTAEETAATGKAEPPAIRGHITGEASAPVAGARVIALDLEAWKAAGPEGDRDSAAWPREDDLKQAEAAFRERARSLPETRSGPDGAYSFHGLRPGQHRLLVIQPEHLPSADSFVAVAAGRTAVADVRLAPAAAISGRVVDGQGRPVAGAALRAAAAGLEAGPPRGREIALLAWEEGLPLLAPGEAVSGADGSFRLASLEFLPHDVVARGDGHLAAHAWGVPAGTSDLVLALDPGAAVIGRVLDAGGVPIAGARVEARPGRSPEVHRLYDWGNWHEDPGRDQAHDARTPADGRFRIAGLQPGAHELQVTADGRTPVLRQVEIAGDLLDLGDIRLDPELEAAGSVVTAAGVPVPGARVRALRQERSARSANSMSLTSVPPLVETRSDGNGRFVLKGVPAGPFRVSAESDEFAAGEAAGVRGGDPAVKVVLEEGIVIHGRVIDGDRSGPIAGVEIKAGFQGEKRVMSDAGGAFTIRGFAPAGLHRGRVTLRASHPDFSPLWQDLNGLGTTPGKPLEIRLTRAGRIRGRILDAGGLPLAGARVWIEVSGLSRETMGWNPVSGIRAISAADGTYALPPPQSLDNIIGDLAVQVVARHSNLATGRSAPLELPRSGEDWPEVEVTLTAGVGVEGRIVDQGGAPVGRARVAVRRSEGESETLSASSLGSGILDRVGYSGADGRYTVRGLEPGPVVVDVLALGYARQTLAGLEVGGDSAPGASAEILRVDVVLERGGELAGRVIEEGVAPVAGAEVVAFPEDSSADAGPGNRSEFEKRMEKMTLRGRESARTDAGGRFRIQGLRDQTFRAVARAPGYEPAELAGLKPGEDVPDLKLLRFSAIHGRVVAAGTREPVGSFTVDVVNTEKRAAMQKRGGYFDPRLGTEGAVRYADPEGQFTYDGLRPGPYEVTVWAAGFIAASREVAIVTGSEAPIEIELERGGNLQGFVREEGTGAPILGAMVGVYHRMSDPGKADRASYQYGLDSVPSAADGSFIVAGLRDGTYSVSAWHPFYRVTGKQPEATVEGGKGPPELELELAPAGRLEVEVKGLPRGHPRKRSVRCSVALEMVEEGEAEDAKKPRFAQPIHRDSSGLFVAEHLAPGTYRVILKEQEMEAGEAVHLGPMGGFQASVPRGEEKKTPLGEVEVRARETSRFTARKP